MLILAKMGYNIISNISRILRILYHIIYPTKRYYIRYRYAKTYIFPTTVNNKVISTTSDSPSIFFYVKIIYTEQFLTKLHE